MADFYATFMQKQAFKNMYVEIVADNESFARQAMFDHFGGKFFTVYPEEKFTNVISDFNLVRLCRIYVINHAAEGQEPNLEFKIGGI